MAKADPHRTFVTAWREYGERWLLTDAKLVGPDDAWFKVCKSTRFWDDASLPPEKPGRQAVSAPVKKYKPPKKRAPRKAVSVRVLALIGRELTMWADFVEDHSMPAHHRDREAEFHAKMEQELRELQEGNEWLKVA
jgi:hypothetical protein